MSQYFKLERSQSELDFVDVPISGDIRLFVDPFALGLDDDPWMVDANNLVVDFFEQTVQALRRGDAVRAHYLLGHLHEPKETHLGYSSPGEAGRGIGAAQSDLLYERLRRSKAVASGALEDLSDAELIVPGIGDDKVSDITINVIRRRLIGYTQGQCELLGIPTQSVAAPPQWDDVRGRWLSEYVKFYQW